MIPDCSVWCELESEPHERGFDDSAESAFIATGHALPFGRDPDSFVRSRLTAAANLAMWRVMFATDFESRPTVERLGDELRVIEDLIGEARLRVRDELRSMEADS